jgi:hypothetical protein
VTRIEGHHRVQASRLHPARVVGTDEVYVGNLAGEQSIGHDIRLWYFVDIDLHTLNMSLEALTAKLEAAEKTGRLPKIVIAVDFGGLSCDLPGSAVAAVLPGADRGAAGLHRGDAAGDARGVGSGPTSAL